MKKNAFLLLIIMAMSFSALSQVFKSDADVLVYLSQKKFKNSKSGVILTFSEMATTLSTGNQVYYSPKITVISSTTAIVSYSNVNDPSFSGSFLVKATSNLIIDRSNTSQVYTYIGDQGGLPGAIPVTLSRPSKLSGYNISKTNDGLYLITRDNTPVFYLAPENLYYNDFSTRLSYEQVSDLVKNFKIGDKQDWRLPTYTELEIIYNLQNQLTTSLKGNMYWSSTKSVNNPGTTVKCIMFKDRDIVEGIKYTSGRIHGVGFENYGYPLAVRDLNPQKISPFITLDINESKKMMIASHGFKSRETYVVTYSSATTYIKELNQENFNGYNDWRLPTIEELRLLYKNKEFLEEIDGYYANKDFWSSTISYIEETEYSKGDVQRTGTCYFVKNFKDGYERNNYKGDGLNSYNYSASILIIRDGPIESTNSEWYQRILVGKSLGQINFELNDFCVYRGELYVGGVFFSLDGNSIYSIGKYNGKEWSSVGTAFDHRTVNTIVEFKGELYAGGFLCGVKKLVDGEWHNTFMEDGDLFKDVRVNCMIVYHDELYVGCWDPHCNVNKILLRKWNGEEWSTLEGDISNDFEVSALAIFNNELYIGLSSSSREPDIATSHSDPLLKWDGYSFSKVPFSKPTNCAEVRYISKLIEFNRELYISYGANNSSAGGTNCGGVVKWNGTEAILIAQGFIFTDMTIYKNDLYICGGIDGRIGKWDGSKFQFISVPIVSLYTGLGVFNNKLFFGNYF